MKKLGLIKSSLIVVAFLTACVTAVKFGSRDPAQDPHPGVPTGLVGPDVHDYYHLSEGADVYPYEWLIALKSAMWPVNGEIKDPYLNNLDKKFGVLPAPSHGNPYLLDWAGMSVAWSNHLPSQGDALRKDPPQMYRTLPTALVFDEKLGRMVPKQNVRSIKMVGTNCALCHTSQIDFKGEKFRIDGGSNMINVRGFFQDMALSTLAMLAKPDVLEAFLKNFPRTVGDPAGTAKVISNDFLHDLGNDARSLGWLTEHSKFLQWLSSKKALGAAKIAGDRRWLYRGSPAIGRALEKLLRATYGWGPNDEIGDLHRRMQYFGKLMVGTNPANEETPSGFARTDAFGRIGNLVLRGDHPIDYTAPVSLPWMWGLKYQAMLHYTANTNSVIMRNVGQSLGLGSQIFATKQVNPSTGKEEMTVHGSTVNIFNLDRLERLIHKIKVPQWEETFAKATSTELQISERLRTSAANGKKIYEAKCAKCHSGKTPKVGPANALHEYPVIHLDEIKTDKWAAINCALPIEQGEGKEEIFQDAILSGTLKIKEAYYNTYRSTYNITKDEEKRLEFAWLRGPEFFRDTLYGYPTKQGEVDIREGKAQLLNPFYGKLKPGKDEAGYRPYGYQARHLAGVWATAPYLHNGSVPDMWMLLQPSVRRPKIFNVQSREFNPETLGYAWTREKATDKKSGQVVDKPCEAKGDDKCFDTNLKGNANTGHESDPYDSYDYYGTNLKDSEKQDLIEYLKVLPPEPEYGDPVTTL